MNENPAENFLHEVQYTEARFFWVPDRHREHPLGGPTALLIDTYIKDAVEKDVCCTHRHRGLREEEGGGLALDRQGRFAERLVAFAAVEASSSAAASAASSG